MRSQTSDTSDKAIICKNCRHEFQGAFCNLCSQSADADKIDRHEVIHHLPYALFHADKGLWHTIKEMTFRPRLAIREYLNGKRVDHFNSFLFIVIMGDFDKKYLMPELVEAKGNDRLITKIAIHVLAVYGIYSFLIQP